MTLFLDMFEPIIKGDFGLTEEAVYKSIQAGEPFVPLWGGNKEHNNTERMVSIKAKTKSGDKITIFDGEGTILSLDGSAGCMTPKTHQRFALNHHAGFFKLRKDAVDNVIPRYFVLFYQNQLQNASISEGSKTLTLEQIYEMNFELPPFTVQKEVIRKLEPILAKKEKIEKIINGIKDLQNRILSHGYNFYQGKGIPIKEVIAYMSGNSGLTEKVIANPINI